MARCSSYCDRSDERQEVAMKYVMLIFEVEGPLASDGGGAPRPGL
jgi:hypothetical protein